jgi:electron transfer flavoprotein alpha subunit
MSTLILAAHDRQQLDPATACLVSAAQRFGQPVEVLVFGPDSAEVAAQAASLQGVSRVLHVAAPDATPPNAETVARLLAALADRYDVLLAAHNLAARAALPRAAALTRAAYLSDVTAIPTPDSVVRPLYAGAVLSTARVTAPRMLLTIRAAAFAPVDVAAVAAPIEAVAPVEADTRTQLLGCETSASSRPDLTRARVVVAGGRGVGSAEHMRLVEALADRLGGAVGASRAAVDAGFAPNAVQVGQTGKVVAPEVYIAAGISGAIQHVAGIKDAKVIVAINKDPDAPIFSVADVGLVGDLFEVLPALTAALPALA